MIEHVSNCHGEWNIFLAWFQQMSLEEIAIAQRYGAQSQSEVAWGSIGDEITRASRSKTSTGTSWR